MRMICFLFLFLALSVGAQAQSVATTDHARSLLAAETDGVAPGGETTLVFSQILQDGWHVYWKNPGDSGLPLDFKWTLPDGFAAGPIQYPAPERIPVGPLVNFGHQGEPVFLVQLHAPADAVVGEVIAIELSATWLICEDICVPENADFSLSLPIVGDPQPAPGVQGLVAAARAAAPKTFAGDAVFTVDRKNITLELKGLEGDFTDGYFFPDFEGVTEPAGKQRLQNEDGRLRIDAPIGYAADAIEKSPDLVGVIALDGADGMRVFEIAADRSSALASRNDDANIGAGALVGLLVAAFFGGALLNLMPCVFPILFIKAANLAQSRGAHPVAQRRHGAVYAIGVVTTFLALGGALLALRAGGESLGWGFHLQSPVVVALSGYVLFAVALNLAGVFSIGESLQGVGAGAEGLHGDSGSFLTGVLAVFVAAPCVGPFLTAPVGAAAVLPALPALSIFAAMGAGLAAPYVLVSSLPGVSRRLPKPGPWMVRFRQLLAFPVFAAAAFFIWVLGRQTGSAGLAVAFTGLIVLALTAYMWEWAKSAEKGGLKFVVALLLATSVGLLSMLAGDDAPDANVAASYGGIEAVAFDPVDIERRRAAGETIFVDYTAAWCVTCQVNKMTVLAAPKVLKAFRENSVTLVTADWTRRDSEIERSLASFGANGVPLYVVYRDGGAAEVLAQPLTEKAIIAALGA